MGRVEDKEENAKSKSEKNPHVDREENRQAEYEEIKEILDEQIKNIPEFIAEDALKVLNDTLSIIAQFPDDILDDPYLNSKKLKKIGCTNCNSSTASKLKKEAGRRRKDRKRKEWQKIKEEHGRCDYFDNSEGGISYYYETKDGQIEIPITNFKGYFSSQKIRNDGIEDTREFTFEGIDHLGKKLSTLVTCSELEKTTWVAEKLGAGCIVLTNCPPSRLKEALQTRGIHYSKNKFIPEEKVFGHLGIKKIDGNLGFLHRGGFLTKDSNKTEILVDLEDEKLNSVDFLDPSKSKPEELKNVVKDSIFSFLDGAPKNISIPILCSVFSAPLATIFPTTHTDFITGSTGTFKTSFGGVAQAFFGKKFQGDFMIDSFASTPKQIERMMFVAKNVYVIIDECTSDGTPADEQRVLKAAKYIIDIHANKNPRKRLTSDSRQNKNVYISKCSLGITGESLPLIRESLLARLYTIVVNPGDIDKEKLTKLQDKARKGDLSLCMAAYIQFVLKHYLKLGKELPERFIKLRDELNELNSIHSRSPNNIAEKLIAFGVLMDFAVSIGAMSTKEAISHKDEAKKVLIEGIKSVAEYQNDMNPAENFIRTLMEGLAGGAFHLASNRSDGNLSCKPHNPLRMGWEHEEKGLHSQWKTCGAHIGWIVDSENENQELLLIPSVAFGQVKKQALNTAKPLNISSQNDMWKRLKEAGFIEKTAKGRNSVQRTTPSGRQRVIVISLNAVAAFLEIHVSEISNVKEEPKSLSFSQISEPLVEEEKEFYDEEEQAQRIFFKNN